MADFGVAGVLNQHTRRQTELDGLLGQRIGTGNHRLAGDDGGGGSEHNQRNQAPLRHAFEKGVVDGGRVAQQQCALADVVERERRQHHAEPGGLNRFAAEVSHIGIQRFGAGYRQYHCAEADKAVPAVMRSKMQAVIRVYGHPYMRVLADLVHTRQRQHGKPGQHNRAEQRADALSTIFLN